MQAGSNNSDDHRYDDLIARALATEGGHLSIGRGGFILWYSEGARLAGSDTELIKAACIKAGLPVIDGRGLDFAAVVRLALHGPMIAVGTPPDPPPHGAFTYAPLAMVAAAYRAAGAEVFNLPDGPAEDRGGDRGV
ncbi:hypothetical protein [Acidiphilium multivorum]|uniref:hypothetical protein n=1 Tax=Acidiphilium multivorum TaxID=62140 RepID=UPI001B8B3419|nr:hypothetical protein [Acidiphilium multivorum]MBS3025298.1 hypothetical protein [Acidiphilium multivorum]